MHPDGSQGAGEMPSPCGLSLPHHRMQTAKPTAVRRARRAVGPWERCCPGVKSHSAARMTSRNGAGSES